MGLIKNIFGGIFSLIGGIFGSLAKVVGLGKKSEFFMELDESEQPAPSKSQSVASQSTPATKPAASQTNQTAAKPEPDPAAPVQVAASSKELPKKGQGSFKEQIPAVSQTTSQPQPPADKMQAKMPEIANFATDYLVNPRTNSSPRRRPGPSLSPFKNMVKDMGRKSASMG